MHQFCVAEFWHINGLLPEHCQTNPSRDSVFDSGSFTLNFPVPCPFKHCINPSLLFRSLGSFHIEWMSQYLDTWYRHPQQTANWPARERERKIKLLYSWCLSGRLHDEISGNKACYDQSLVSTVNSWGICRKLFLLCYVYKEGLT